MGITEAMRRADDRELRRLRHPRTLSRPTDDLGVRLSDATAAEVDVANVEQLPVDDVHVRMCETDA